LPTAPLILCAFPSLSFCKWLSWVIYSGWLLCCYDGRMMQKRNYFFNIGFRRTNCCVVVVKVAWCKKETIFLNFGFRNKTREENIVDIKLREVFFPWLNACDIAPIWANFIHCHYCGIVILFAIRIGIALKWQQSWIKGGFSSSKVMIEFTSRVSHLKGKGKGMVL